MSDATLDALIAAIDGESAAVYAYGVAIPRLSGSLGDLARGGLTAHRLRIVSLRQRIPVADQPASAGGFDVDTPTDTTQAASLLAGVEVRLAAVYADLAAATTGTERRDAVLSARECAVRSVAWGGEPQAFPGR
jgi:hypothetical protein